MSVYSGNSFSRGVAFHNNNKISIAYRDKNGNITVKTSQNTLAKQRGILKKIPFVRGIVVLLDSFISAWKTSSKGIIAIIVLGLTLQFGGELVFGEAMTTDVVSEFGEKYFLLIVLGLGFIISRATGIAKYHGAEHMVFNASKAGLPLTMQNIKSQKRYALECGTNLIVFILTIFTLLQLVQISFIISFTIGCSIGYEVFIVKNSLVKKMLTPFYLLGFGFQFFIFTAKPSDKELEVALQAINGMIRK